MALRNRLASLLLASAAVGLPSSRLQAAIFYWQGGTGNFVSTNYFNVDTSTPGVNPPNNGNATQNNTVNFGAGGTATFATGATRTFRRLRVGHGESSGGQGTGVITVNSGSIINLTAPETNADVALRVGGNANIGTLNIDGAGSSVNATDNAGRIWIGYAPGQPSLQGIVNVTNGGALTAGTQIRLGEGSAGNGNRGMQGHLYLSDVAGLGSTVSGSALYVGVYTATSSYNQSGGAATFTGAVEVSVNTAGSHNSNNNSSFNISGGAFSNGGNFFVGRGTATNATVNITGGTLTVGGRFLMGGQTATGQKVIHSAGSLIMTNQDLRVGDASPTGTSTYNLSGAVSGPSASVITSAQGAWVGREGTAYFYQTGGTANFNTTNADPALRIGVRDGTGPATTGLYQISGGVLNVGGNANIATTTSATGQLRVVGDEATIDVGGNMTFGGAAATLAYELQGTELLSVIDVAGAATFNNLSKLIFDASNAAPTQYVYDLLTATSITDSGIVFTGPADWDYRIVSGGNGQILQAYNTLIPEPATLCLALVAGVVALRCRRYA